MKSKKDVSRIVLLISLLPFLVFGFQAKETP
jgi:hypothetical protein